MTETTKILIVDDDESIRRGLKRQLSRVGCEVVEASSGEEALSMAPEEQPDVVLLDINMPGIDGMEVCRRLRADPAIGVIYVIMLTGEHNVEVESLDVGADDHIAKPYQPEALLARVRAGMRAVAQLRGWIAAEEEARFETIQRLVAAAEFRDPETAAHILRMSHFSRLLAEKIGLPEPQCDTILRAAPMHDIGKVGTPDAILLKPGRHTPEETVIMHQHAEHGFEILVGSKSPLLQMGAEVAHTHHEKWDGSGYPRGLMGEAIPLVGRIVAVADVFDALTSERPYKKAWPLEKAIDFLQEQTGRHFDPGLVPVFLDNLTAVLEIQAEFSDDEPPLHNR